MYVGMGGAGGGLLSMLFWQPALTLSMDKSVGPLLA
jgi:hypothetical protein